jgi:hypothetical protein
MADFIMDKYFWIFCGLFVGVGHALSCRMGHKKWITKGVISRSDSNRFCLTAALWILLPCAVLWMLQEHLQEGSDWVSWPSVYRYAAACTVTIPLLILGILLWLRNGAKKFTKYYYLGYLAKNEGKANWQKQISRTKLIGTASVVVALFFTWYKVLQ